jgi:hypothetical protein
MHGCRNSLHGHANVRARGRDILVLIIPYKNSGLSRRTGSESIDIRVLAYAARQYGIQWDGPAACRLYAVSAHQPYHAKEVKLGHG